MPSEALSPRLRLWAPVGDEPTQGFGVEDGDWYRHVLAPEVKRLDELVDVPCLFLLGEPGMGKSTSLRAEVDRLRENPMPGCLIHSADLAEVSSDAGLDHLFSQPTFERWREGEGTLHLFLDSYDESLRRYPTLKARLLATLRNQPLHRLRLRVACRAGDFPGHLPADIQGIWPSPSDDAPIEMRTCLLQPLSRSAVYAWADTSAVDSAAFVAEVERHNARSFAARPISLRPLIAQYRSGQFPESEVALFDGSTRSLCREVHPDRRAEATLSEDERVAVAERIAVLTTLAGNDRVWTGDRTQIPDGAMPLAHVVGGQDDVGGITVVVDYSAVQETLATALFTVLGPDLLGWSQQVYREFLAARFFARRLHRKEAAVQFLEHPGRAGLARRAIAPQLAETAAWLAAMDDGIACWIAEYDPGVLLRGRHHIPASLRQRLVDWWFIEERQGRTVEVRRTETQLRDGLSHPNLAGQISNLLTDRNAALRARALACELAEIMQVNALASTLVALALSEDESYDVRGRAVRALRGIGTPSHRATLRPLLGSLDGDTGPAHRFRAYLLGTLWPEQISAADVLKTLAAHKVDLADEYASLVEYRFVQSLQDADITEAITWITDTASEPLGPLEHLISEIVEAAAKRIDNDDVRNVLAGAMVTRIRHHAYFVSEQQRVIQDAFLQNPDEVRLRLADDIAAQFRPDDDPFEVDRWIAELQLPHSAVLERLTETDDPVADLWVRALRADPRTWQSPECPPLIRGAIALMATDSDVRRRLEDLEQQVLEAASKSHQADSADGAASGSRYSRQRTIVEELKDANENPATAWLNLCDALNMDETTGTWVRESILSTTPGWQEASAATREELVALARKFLTVVPEEHPDARRRNAVQSAGFMATLLLADTAPAELSSLSGDEWVFWLHGILVDGSGMADQAPLQRLLSRAYAAFPERIRSEVHRLLGDEERPWVTTGVIRALDVIFDSAVVGTLLTVLEDATAPLSIRTAVLTTLLRHGESRAVDIALTWTERTDSPDEAVTAARSLLLHGGQDAVQRLLPALHANWELAQRSILEVAVQSWHLFPLQDFPPALLADLYLLAVDLYPPADDPPEPLGYMREISGREQVVQWRDRTLGQLVRDSSWEAVAKLEEISEHRPDLALPRHLWHEAEQAALLRSWTELSDPRTALQVIEDQRRRVIRSADQLLDLIVEALGRLQDQLIRSGGAADLWSEWPDDSRRLNYRPKYELSISDYVKRFLDRDLQQYTISSNREVENRPGNETDILVTYVDRDVRGREVRRYHAVIEVKGAWHAELLTAMETQLANRYLVDYETDRGIYLVGWFRCDLWDSRDRSRRTKPSGYSLLSLSEELRGQATRLSTDARRVEAVVLDAALRLTPRQFGVRFG